MYFLKKHIGEERNRKGSQRTTLKYATLGVKFKTSRIQAWYFIGALPSQLQNACAWENLIKSHFP